jgi:hypothetical protein
LPTDAKFHDALKRNRTHLSVLGKSDFGIPAMLLTEAMLHVTS